MKIPEDGLFGKLNPREHRLVAIGVCLGLLLMAPIFVEFIRLLIAGMAFLIVLVISINQYHRIKAGLDPKDPG